MELRATGSQQWRTICAGSVNCTDSNPFAAGLIFQNQLLSVKSQLNKRNVDVGMHQFTKSTSMYSPSCHHVGTYV